MAFWKQSGEGILLSVRVIPRSSRSEIVGEHNDALKIKLTAPPVEGAANFELISLLAKFFAVSKSNIEIIGGAASKNKQILLRQINAEIFESRCVEIK